MWIGNFFAQRVGLGTAVNAIVNFVLEVLNGLSNQMGYFSSFVYSHRSRASNWNISDVANSGGRAQ